MLPVFNRSARGLSGSEAGIAEKAKCNEQKEERQNEFDSPALFKMLLEWDTSKNDGREQKHQTKHDQTGALDRFCLGITFPKKRIYASTSKAAVFPENVSLSGLYICSELLQIARFFHLSWLQFLR